ncbi:MAG TPA: VOC family protein [Nitrolancea sp.]|jgi:catechol 2,3-dioxygenase-like lactoylglutathione lyase family enzyme|nr:VOC family protein [Nitrolancea sp.]
MHIELTSVMVNDQSAALTFYTEILGFVMKHDIPVGEDRWLTVVSPHGPSTVELLLEPNHNPMLDGAERTFQRALFKAGIPITGFRVDDIHAEYARLQALGVRFTIEPAEAGEVTAAVFDDTCGNLLQIYQV